LQFLNKQVTVQLNDFVSELSDLGSLAGNNPELALEIADLVLE